ncbi:MAG: hypothetical protein E6H09_03065 [Bacteroidetes bacterium]|jgi:hypothetical protein|nr:MAG: hypothetical protein E6H09_03065 [Bacteroidota bacterium]
MTEEKKAPDILVSLTLSIKECKCLSFSFTDYALKNKKQIALDQYEFTFTLTTQIFENEKLFSVVIETKLFEKQSENVKIELAELKAKCAVAVINFDEVIRKTDDKSQLLIPDQLFLLCNTLTVSAVRGMFSIKLDDTIYSNALLPIVDPNLFLPTKIIA